MGPGGSREGWGLFEGEGEGEGLGDGEALGLGDGEGLGEGEALGEGLGLGETRAELGEGEGEGSAVHFPWPGKPWFHTASEKQRSVLSNNFLHLRTTDCNC